MRTVQVCAGLLLLAVYIIGSGWWVSNSGGWYAALNRPAWQPPNWVFGVAWPYNFTVLAVAAFQIPRRLSAPQTWMWLGLFAASIAAALAWAYLFYGPHRLTASACALATAALLTVGLVLLAARASSALAWFLAPYQLWLFVATSLSIGYAVRN